MYPATAAISPASRVMPKIRHQSPFTSWADRRSAATGPWPSKTTAAGARQTFIQSQTASGPVARAPTTPSDSATAAPLSPSMVSRPTTSPKNATMTSRTGTIATSDVRITAPITGKTRAHALRHTVENATGLPRTASCSTAGTAAYIRPETTEMVTMPSSPRTMPAVTSGTTSVDDAVSSWSRATTRSRWSETAE